MPKTTTRQHTIRAGMYKAAWWCSAKMRQCLGSDAQVESLTISRCALCVYTVHGAWGNNALVVGIALQIRAQGGETHAHGPSAIRRKHAELYNSSFSTLPPAHHRAAHLPSRFVHPPHTSSPPARIAPVPLSLPLTRCLLDNSIGCPSALTLRAPPASRAVSTRRLPLPIFAGLAVHAVLVVPPMHRCHLASSPLVDICIRDLCYC